MHKQNHRDFVVEITFISNMQFPESVQKSMKKQHIKITAKQK